LFKARFSLHTVEPGLYVEGLGGFCVSDPVVVTKGDMELVTYSPCDLELDDPDLDDIRCREVIPWRQAEKGNEVADTGSGCCRWHWSGPW
jgi:hypothetical protein